MSKFDRIAHRPHRPDRTRRTVDAMLPWFGLLFGLTVAGHLMNTDVAGLPRAPMLFGGCLVGLLLPRLHHHRFRVLGFIPFASGLGAIVAAVASGADLWGPPALGLFGLFEGLAVGAILRYRDRVRLQLLEFTSSAVVGVVIAVAVIVVFHKFPESATRELAQQLLLAAALIFPPIALWCLRQAFVELCVEPFFRRMYRTKVVGEGLAALPLEGPVLMIANHAAWFDPLFVAEVVPRATTHMMTASFYDKPGLRQLMRHVFRTIRVAEVGVRKEAPELAEAVKALEVGRCVVLFPEGYLRRKEEQTIRRFGRGVWQILSLRPQTPVVPCWIEGSWGCYFSHANGPPTKNKSKDRRRDVTIAVGTPIVVPTDILADQWSTRVYLMKQLLLVRKQLGLPDVASDDLVASEETAASR